MEPTDQHGRIHVAIKCSKKIFLEIKKFQLSIALKTPSKLEP